MAEYDKPLPRPEIPDLTQPFWDAAKRHELVLPRCLRCNQYFWYPREICPDCLQTEWEWAPASGRGRLYSFTVVRQPLLPQFADDVPYAYALVQLDEGPRMVTNIVDCEIPDGLEVDMLVEATYDDVSDDYTVVKFRPA